MNDSETLLGKADALLLRLRSSADSEIPVLTEIVECPKQRDRKDSSQPELLPPTASFNGIDIEELCQRLHMQLAQSLEQSIKEWVNEIFHAKLRQEFERMLPPSVDRAIEQSRDEIDRRIESALLNAIDAEFRARLRTVK